MRHRIWIGVVCLVGITVAFAALGWAGSVIHVPLGASIQAAIDGASDGDTIVVAAGTFNESIVVSKSITLQGAQAGVDPRPSIGGRTGPETVLDASEGSSSVIRITAANVTIDGFTITGGTGDMVEEGGSADFLHFANNILYDDLATSGDEAIQIKYSTGVTIEYNYAYDIVQDAFNLSASTNGAVQYNEAHNIHSENAAIYCYDVDNVSIIGNLIYDVPNNDGIKLGDSGDGSTGGSVSGNVVHDCAEDGITVYANSVDILDNEIYACSSENGALYLYQSDGSLVQGNIIRDNVALGLLIRNSTGVNVNGNKIFGNDDWDDTKYPGSAGVWIASDSPGTILLGNEIHDNAVANAYWAGTGVFDASCNWWGTDDPAAVAAWLDTTNMDFSPMLSSGVDGDPGTSGWQPDLTAVTVHQQGQQIGTAGRIQEGIDLTTSLTVTIAAGTYNEDVNIGKSVVLSGVGNGDDPSSNTILGPYAANQPIIQIQAGGASAVDRLIVRDMRLTGATGSGNPGSGIEMDIGSGSWISFLNIASVVNGGSGITTDFFGVIESLELIGCALTDNGGSGFNFNSTHSVDGLLLQNCVMERNAVLGAYLEGPLNDLQVVGGQYNDNADAGIYVLRLNSGFASPAPTRFTDVTASGNQRGFYVYVYGGPELTFERVLAADNSGYKGGLTVIGEGSTPLDLLHVTESSFLDNEVGITLKPDAVGFTQVLIDTSVISGNHDGIRTHAGNSNAAIRYCSLTGNNPDEHPLWGALYLYNGADQVDAALNWWGSTDGPWVDLDKDDVPEYDGGGDRIYGDAVFSPWLGIDPDGDPGTVGVQLISPMLIVVDDVGPAPAGGYLDMAITGANDLVGSDVIEVRPGTYCVDEPITDGVAILSTNGACETTIGGQIDIGSAGVLLGAMRSGFRLDADVRVLPGKDASLSALHWNDIYGTVENAGLGTLDATYNFWGAGGVGAQTIGSVNTYPILPLSSCTIIGYIDDLGMTVAEALVFGGLIADGYPNGWAKTVTEIVLLCGISEEQALALIFEYNHGRVKAALRRAGNCAEFYELLEGYVMPAGGGGAAPESVVAGEPLSVAILIVDPLTGDGVTDALVTLTVTRDADPVEFVYFGVLPYNTDLGMYASGIDTTGWEPGTYHIYIGTDRMTWSEDIVEVTAP